MHYSSLVSMIRDRRRDLNVSQDMLSQLSGVGLRTLKQLESDKGNPRLKTLEKVAAALGLELTLVLRKVKGPEPAAEETNTL